MKLDELTDSKEMFEARVSTGIPFFIGIVVSIILVGVIGCYVGEIDIVVKAKGVIKTSEKVTRITNKVLGEVE
ncbi:imidazoleglycerol-phosphate dehydratase, partial [Paenibacillus popilliae ATCC 14706]